MTRPAPAAATPTHRALTPAEAGVFLLHHLRLRRSVPAAGGAGVRDLLDHLGCFQLDPLDRIGTNADLVALARVDDLKKGEVYTHAFAAGAFEHFAKERCLLPASLFPAWRDQAVQTPWWRLSEQAQRVPPAVLDAVLAEVAARGPLPSRALGDHGRVVPVDWSGWKGTSSAATQALQVLWTRCQVVVAGRAPNGDRLYDLPTRALGPWATAPAPTHFETAALLARVASMGLLPRATGPWWSMLRSAQQSDLPERLVRSGALVSVQLPGSRRTWLAPGDFEARLAAAHAAADDDDDRMRILAPLDPLLWSRPLVQQVFGFDYVWEVYKPEPTRRFGYYVCPLLHRGRLVGRLEGRVREGRLAVDQVWREAHGPLDPAAFSAALARHAQALGAEPPSPHELAALAQGATPV